MKTLRCFLVWGLLLAFFTPVPAQANAGEYTFSVSLGTYDDISDEAGYTALTVADLNSDADDGWYCLAAPHPTLPFTFNYDGVDYTTACVNINGWLGMGHSYDMSSSWVNNMAFTFSKPWLAPLWDDLRLPAEGQIGYVTLGAAPNRVFVVQWANVVWQLASGTFQNFQVRLYETNNVIKFVYGSMNEPTNSPSASIGIIDATGGSGHYLSVTPASGTGDTASSTTANNAIASAANLPGGKTYTFTPLDPNAPPSCAINVGPADGATDVVLNAALNWRAGNGIITGYRLYFGTDNPPTNIANGEDLGNVTTYDPPGTLAPNTPYYWQVVPYNTNGDATGCPVWSFTTGASISSDLLNESFTGVPFPPTGWTIPTAGACAWSRVTAGSNPTQSPYSAPAEARFNSYDCSADNYKQLLSPALNFSAAGEYVLTFWMYHDTLYANTFPDRLQVQVSLDGGSTFTDVGAEIARYTGANSWAQHTLDLSAYAGQASVRVVFNGISGYGSNMFLDDVRVVQTVAASRPNCALSPAPVNEATSVPLAANLTWANGGGVPDGYKLSFGVDNPPTSIAQNIDLGNVTTYDPAALMAANTLHYWQIVPYNSFGDAENCPVWSFTTGAAPLNVFPYVEGFESGAGGWTSGGVNSSWALGTPNGATIQGASTGNNAWATGLTTNYNNNEQSYVQSPAFNFSGLTHPYVKFDLWWESEYDYDGATLQASLDGGTTWEPVGSSDWIYNWFNSTPDALNQEDWNDGWSGDPTTDGDMDLYNAAYIWRTAMHDLADLAGEPYVLLRFLFGSDADITFDGFAFDNFEIRSGCAWLETAVSNDWQTAANWDCGHVPGAEEIAMLPWFDDAITATIASDVSVAAVGVDDNLILDGGDLTTRYVYEYGVVYITEGNEVNLVGSGNAWEATWQTMDEWAGQWGATTNGRVRFSGPGVQRIVHDYETDYFPPTAYAQFYNVQVDNGSYLDVKSNLLVARNLTVQSGGTVDMRTFALGVNGALVNNGTLRQQKTVGTACATTAFLSTGGYGGLELYNCAGHNPGLTTVQIRGGQDCTTVPGETLKRCFNITPETSPGDPGVALTFYFSAADLPDGHSCNNVELYHWDGAWSSPLTRDLTYATAGRQCTTEPYAIRVTGVSDFSPFVLSGSGAAPTAVSLQQLRAAPNQVATSTVSGLALAALALYATSLRRKTEQRKHRAH